MTHQLRRAAPEEEAIRKGLVDLSIQMKGKEAQEMFEIVFRPKTSLTWRQWSNCLVADKAKCSRLGQAEPPEWPGHRSP